MWSARGGILAVMARSGRPARRGDLRRRVIRIARASPAWTAEQIAEAAGCHASTVRKHLSGLRTPQPLSALHGDQDRIDAAWAPRPRFVAGLRHLAADVHREVRYRAARQTDCPPGVVARFAADPSWSVRQSAAANPNCPQPMLARLAKDRVEQVRAAVLARGDISVSVFLRAAASDRVGRYQAAVSARCPQPVLERLAEDPDESVRAAAAQRVQQPAALMRLCGDRSARVRHSVASRPAGTCPAEIVEALAGDEDARVRAAVAGREDCPAGLLVRLAGDRCDGVREAAASHRGLDAGMLDALAADSCSHVRAAVASHRGCRPETRRMLRTDSHEVVRDAARRRSLA